MLRRVFRVANANGMAIVVHMRTPPARTFGSAQADQRSSMSCWRPRPTCGADLRILRRRRAQRSGADQALAVFTAAIARHDPRCEKSVLRPGTGDRRGDGPVRKAVVAQRIRDIGVNRILYGTDGGDPTDPPPKTQVQALHALPLTRQRSAPSKPTSRRTCADGRRVRGIRGHEGCRIGLRVARAGCAGRGLPSRPAKTCARSAGSGSRITTASA
jgi:hypothetical protein